jgi:glucosylceramidase
VINTLIVMAVLVIVATPMAYAQTDSVDFTTNLTRVDGFGFSDAFGQASNIKSLPAPQQQQVLDLLFNRSTGAGFSMYRLGIITDSNIEPTSPGSPDATPTYVFDGSDGNQVWLAQTGQKYGLGRYFADAWSAPAYMKTNNNVSNGGSLCGVVGATCSSGDWRQAYANYLVQYVKFYKQVGIPISAVGFTNEPDLSTSYASMQFSTDQAIDFVKVFGPTIQNSGLPLAMLCCDASKWSVGITYTSAVASDPTADSFVGIYSSHQYGSHATTPLPTNKTVWMTEWSSSNGTINFNWDCGGCSGGPDGMYLANDIIQAFNAGNVNAYVYWWGAGSGAANLIQTSRSSYTVAKRFYAPASFSRFVRPGAYRVPASNSNANLNLVAFRNTDGSKVIGILNNASTTIQDTLTVDSGSANSPVQTFLTDTTHSIAETDTSTVNGQELSLTLPPRALTLVVLPPQSVQGSVSLVTTASLQKLGDGSFQATVTVTNLGSGTANDVQLSTAALGPATGSTLPQGPLPQSLGSIAPGGYATTVVNFPATAGSSGATVIERYSGSYNRGSFNGSLRAVLP